MDSHMDLKNIFDNFFDSHMDLEKNFTLYFEFAF